jgi:FkbM family methyltransferase
MTAPDSPSAPRDALFELLRPQRLTAVVDIGANPIDGDPPYKAMLGRRLCTVTGFEPQPEALAALNASKSDLETYLPHAVGDGGPGILRVTQAPGMTSLFEPNPAVLNCFNGFPAWGTVLKELPVSTRRLDDLAALGAFDMLKIDVQGSELSVFQGGRGRLKQAVAVQTEVSLVPLYKDQPVMGDIDLELRGLGLVPHHFAAINRRMILPAFNANQPFAGVNQAIEADIVYVRDFTRADLMDDEQLKHLALIAQHCYGSYDLAIHCLDRLAKRNVIANDAVERFIGALKASVAAAGAAA